jgi:3-deoxy-D-manno-octulosonic-acid transferase
MAISLGRRLYDLTGRREAASASPWPDRPAGTLVWLHGPQGDRVQSLMHLADRLAATEAIATVLTGPPGTDAYTAPADLAAEVRVFLDHWRPDLIVLSDGEIRPALLFEAEARKIPVLMADAREPALVRGREGWFPGLLRGATQTLRHVYALDEAAARAYRKAGAAQVSAMGRMETASAALPYHEGERAALADMLKARPVWLAAAVPVEEENAVIAAHRAALQLSHRLLLILVPAKPDRATALAARIEDTTGLIVARREMEEEIDPETSVYLPDSTEELGLWYRLAPVTYLGGSLTQGTLRNPMEAAALGSAIIYGPKPGSYGTAFGRLGAARGARAVGLGSDLPEALSDLLAPDQAARLAQAAWSVASEGADVTEAVLAQIVALLKARV